MGTSAEKLVKHTIKLIAKTQELDYSELKEDAKKIIKLSRKYDEQLYGMMEELLDLGNVGSEEELKDFNVEVLKIYCRIKELEEDGSEKSIRARVWENIQEEFELDSDDDEEDDEEDDEDDDDDDESFGEELQEEETEVEVEVEPEPEPEPEPEKPKKSKKKVVV